MDDMIVPVFDIGGVFIDWNPLYLYRKLFDTEEEAQAFLDTVCTPDWNLGLDAGVPYDRAIAELSCRFPGYWAEIAAYDTRWEEMVGGLFEQTIDLHARLVEQGVPTFAITNFSAKKWLAMLPEWDFMQRFDGVVVSGIEKLVKPDPRLFQLFLDRYGLNPQSCLFFDDNRANLVAAEQLGMHVVHVATPKDVRAGLAEYGILAES